MERQQARELGQILRERRETLDLSIRELAEQTGVNHSTVVRLEQGAIDAPAPDKLSRIAEALGLGLADVYALADYAVPDELPTFAPYLKAKYSRLPRKARVELERYFDELTIRYGMDPAGPSFGEDEKVTRRRRKT